MILQLNISEQLGQKFQSIRKAHNLNDEAMVERLLAEYLEDIEDIQAVMNSQKSTQATISSSDLRAELGL